MSIKNRIISAGLDPTVMRALAFGLISRLSRANTHQAIAYDWIKTGFDQPHSG